MASSIWSTRFLLIAFLTYQHLTHSHPLLTCSSVLSRDIAPTSFMRSQCRPSRTAVSHLPLTTRPYIRFPVTGQPSEFRISACHHGLHYPAREYHQ
jgi:hypothetical protein